MIKALLPILALILAVGLALSAAAPAAAQPSPSIQLAVLLDGSDSMDATEWNTEINGLAAAINDSSYIPPDSSVQLTVIQFAGGITGDAQVEWGPGVITASNAAGVATTVQSISKGGGGTPLHAGIDLAVAQITGANAVPSARQVINISLNAGIGWPVDYRDLAEVARDNAIAPGTGIDEISTEAIGDIPTEDVQWLQNRIVYPQPGHLAPASWEPGWVYVLGEDAAKVTEAIGHKIPRYTLTVNSSVGGSVSQPGEGDFTYTAGTVVVLQAVPDSGYEFVNWSGDHSGTANPDTVTMDSGKTVTANFAEDTPSPPPSSREERTPGELEIPFDGTVTPDDRAKFKFVTGPEKPTIVGDHSVEMEVHLQNPQEGIKIAFPIWLKGDRDAPGWGEVPLSEIDASSISLKVKGEVLGLDGEGMAVSPFPLIVITFSKDTYTRGLSDVADDPYGPHLYFYPTDENGRPEITVSGDPGVEWATVTPAYPQYWKGFFQKGDDAGDFLGVVGPTDLASWHDAIVAQDPFYWGKYKFSMGVGYGFYMHGSIVWVDDLRVKIGSDYYAFDFEPGASGGGCFIATAAYGSYLDSHVETLRDFRDSYMVTNTVGSALVSAYYKLSPPVAEFIDDHPALKPVVRTALLPAVAMSTVAVNTTLAQKVAIVGSLALVSVALAVWLSRRRGKGSEYS